MKQRNITPIVLGMVAAAALLLSACSDTAAKATATPAESIVLTQSAAPTATPVPTATPTPSISPTPTPTATPEPQPTTAPHVISIYAPNKAGKREKITDFVGAWDKGKDIECFEALATDADTIPAGRFSTVWQSYWDKYPDAEQCKIGYCLRFTLNSSQEIKRTIRTPDDAQDFREYIEVYLYDDVHQTPGVRYSHIVQSAINKDTICTSIKLTAGSKIDEVKEIHLTAFVYTGDEDFDSATGEYIGNSSYEITLYRSE